MDALKLLVAINVVLVHFVCNGWIGPGVAACNGLWVCYLFFFSLYHTATELGARPLTMLHIVLNHLLHSSHFLVGQVKVALDVHHKV